MDVSGLYSTFASPATTDLPPGDLEGACRAIEKEFAVLVFRKMRQAMVPEGSQGSSRFGKQTAYEMMDMQWAELASRGEGLGLWRALYRQLGGAAGKVPDDAGR